MDTFLDHRTGYEFLANPLGIQGDLAVSNGGNEDDSFDCLWSSAARIDSLGWTAELAIPTKSIRFRNLPVTEWGFWIFRNYPRDTRHQLSSHKMNRGDPCWACQFDHLDSLRGLDAGRNLEVLPYFDAGPPWARATNSGPTAASTDTRVGLSLKYGVTPSLTLDATAHPDFAQVEADQDQIDVNNAAACSSDEKRARSSWRGPHLSRHRQPVLQPHRHRPRLGRQGHRAPGQRPARPAGGARPQHRDRSIPTSRGASRWNCTPRDRGAAVPSTDLVLRVRRDLLRDSNIGFTGTPAPTGRAATATTWWPPWTG